MADTFKPRDAADVEQAIGAAIGAGKTLEVIGHGTKRTIGRAAQWDATLDLSGLSGVTLYEPPELVLSAKAGTPIAEIEALAAASSQELAFEPMDYGVLLGAKPGAGTIGGVLAANLSGPRRIKAGAARDHFLGVAAVSGRGEIFKSGGRVVKNVTGYDLCKLLAGSWGTLAAMTEVTIKTLPKAETETTVLVLGLDDRIACKVDGCGHGVVRRCLGGRTPAGRGRGTGRRDCRRASRGHGVSPRRFRAVSEAAQSDPGTARRAVRYAVQPRCRTVARAMAGDPRRRTLCGRRSGRRARCLAHLDRAHAGRRIGRALAESCDAELLYDWGGGLLWAALPPADDANAPLVHAAVATSGGHATLIRAPAPYAPRSTVFTPEPAALAALTERVRKSFDPRACSMPDGCGRACDR